MALIPVKITKQGRSSSALLSLVLISVEGICGIICLCTGFYIFYIGNGLFSYIKFQLNSLFLFLVVMSVIIIIVVAIGFKCKINLSAQPTNHTTTRIHWTWLLCSICMVLFQLLFVLIITVLQEQLNISLTLSLNHGLSHYYSDTSWKDMMDHLQQSHECCGVQKYTDWYRTSWLPVTRLPQDPDLLDRYAQANNLVQVPLVPSSCCKSISTMCGEKSLSSNKSTSGWSEIKPTDPSMIHTQGCLPILINPLKSALLATNALFLVIIILQCTIMVVSRYLFTSTRNTIVMGNPSGAAIGWLCGRGDLCCSWGKTLPEHDSEIFKDTQVNGQKRGICKLAGCVGKLMKSGSEQGGIKSDRKNKKLLKLKRKKNVKSKSDKKETEQSDNEINDDEKSSPSYSKKFKTFLSKTKVRLSKIPKKSVQLTNSDAKQTLLEQSEEDLTDNELKSLSADKRLSEKFQTRYLNSKRRDETLDIVSIGRKRSLIASDEDCLDCDTYAFADEKNAHSTKSGSTKVTQDQERKVSFHDPLIRVPGDNHNKTQSETKGRGENLVKDAEHVLKPPPVPPLANLIDFGNEHVRLNSDRDKEDPTKIHQQDQNVYLSVSKNALQNPPAVPDHSEIKGRNNTETKIWEGMNSETENFNVQTQTSQTFFKSDVQEVRDHWQKIADQPEKPQVKDSDTVVFRNYRIPPKNKNDARKNYFWK